MTPPEAPALKERDVTKQCVDYLRYRGWWCQRNHVGTFQTKGGGYVTMGPDGIPDYTVIHRHYPAFFLEFKRPGGKLRESQRKFKEGITDTYFLADVKVESLEELMAWLDKHERAIAS